MKRIALRPSAAVGRAAAAAHDEGTVDAGAARRPTEPATTCEPDHPVAPTQTGGRGIRS